MTKEQRELIITIGLVFVLIIALSISFKKMKKKKSPHKEQVRKEEVSDPGSRKEVKQVETSKTKRNQITEEVRKIQLASWQGNWKRDPFLLFRTEKEKSILREGEISFSLSGIVWKEGKPLALIDDHIVREGEILEGYTVVKIDPDKVVLEQAGKKYELFLGK